MSDELWFENPNFLVAWFRKQHVYEDFNNIGKTHDWRNHVPEALRGIWAEMDIQARAAVYLAASQAADREEWD